jgi:type IV secretory pathway VirB2 component (pilin)
MPRFVIRNKQVKEADMLRTAFSIAVAVVIGACVLRIVGGVVGGLLGTLLALAWLAAKVLIFFGAAYFVLSIISPDTARKVRERTFGRPA